MFEICHFLRSTVAVRIQYCIKGFGTFLPVLVTLLCTVPAQASEHLAFCTKDSRVVDESWSRFDIEEFTFWYVKNGRDRLSNLSDTDADSVPDSIQDAALQAIRFRSMLVQAGFKHPFDAPRFAGRGVNRIHFVFEKLSGKTRGQAFRTPRLMLGRECGLMIKVTADYAAPNLTPAHELFHLFQYGYSSFRRRWYLEGLARYVESVFGSPRDSSTGTIPESDIDMRKLFARSYDAVDFWRAIGNTCRLADDQKGRTRLPSAHIRYLSLNQGYAIDPGRINLDFVRSVLELAEGVKVPEFDDKGDENAGRRPVDFSSDYRFLHAILAGCSLDSREPTKP